MFPEELVDINAHFVVCKDRRLADCHVTWIVLAGFVKDNVEVFFAGKPYGVVQLRVPLDTVFEFLPFVRLG